MAQSELTDPSQLVAVGLFHVVFVSEKKQTRLAEGNYYAAAAACCCQRCITKTVVNLIKVPGQPKVTRDKRAV